MQPRKIVVGFNDLIGTIFDIPDLNTVAQITGYELTHGIPTGVLINLIPEVDPIHSKQCKYCKAITAFENSLKKTDFNDFGAEI